MRGVLRRRIDFCIYLVYLYPDENDLRARDLFSGNLYRAGLSRRYGLIAGAYQIRQIEEAVASAKEIVKA